MRGSVSQAPDTNVGRQVLFNQRNGQDLLAWEKQTRLNKCKHDLKTKGKEKEIQEACL